MTGEEREFSFILVDQDGLTHATGEPSDDRDQAFAVAKRLAIDIAENRQGISWHGLLRRGSQRRPSRTPSRKRC